MRCDIQSRCTSGLPFSSTAQRVLGCRLPLSSQTLGCLTPRGTKRTQAEHDLDVRPASVLAWANPQHWGGLRSIELQSGTLPYTSEMQIRNCKQCDKLVLFRKSGRSVSPRTSSLSSETQKHHRWEKYHPSERYGNARAYWKFCEDPRVPKTVGRKEGWPREAQTKLARSRPSGPAGRVRGTGRCASRAPVLGVKGCAPGVWLRTGGLHQCNSKRVQGLRWTRLNARWQQESSARRYKPIVRRSAHK